MKNIINKFFVIIAIVCVASFTACDDNDDNDGGKQAQYTAFMQEEGSVEPLSISCDEVLEGISRSFTISLESSADIVLMGDIVAQPELVEQYNSKNGTAYEPLPENIYKLGKTVFMIPTGKTTSNELSVNFNPTLFGLSSGVKYMLPLTAVLDDTVEDKFNLTRATIYYVIDVDRELVYIPGLDMSNSNSRAELSLPNSEVVTLEGNTHTFEMCVYSRGWNSGVTYMGSWVGLDANNNNEYFTGCDVRCGNSDGATNIGGRQCDFTTTSQGKTLSTKKWHMISIVCEGELTGQNSEVAYRTYFDGELVSENIPTKRWGASSSQRFQVGYTFNAFRFGYPGNSYIFNGLINEVRMWKKALTQEEIKANLKGVDNPGNDMYVYWKCNEGEGSVIKDYSGNGRDLTFKNEPGWSAELNLE